MPRLGRRLSAELLPLFEQLGSNALRRDVELYGDDLLELFLRNHSVHEIIEAAEATDREASMT